MSDTDQAREIEVLRRMLATPPTPHKPLRERRKASAKRSEVKDAHDR